MASAAVWARYQFLEDLWRGQDRIVFDTALEEGLRSGGPGLGHQSHPALAALCDALLPREVVEESVWVALANPRRAAEYARLRGGTTFVGLDEAPGVGTDEDWQVALVDLGGMMAQAGEADDARVSERLEARLAALLEVLGERAAQGRTVAVSAPATAEGGLDYETFAALLGELLPTARVYGISTADAALVFDFGEVEVEVEVEGEVEGDGDEDDLDLRAEYDEGDLAPVGDGDREADEYEADLDAAEDEWTDHGMDGIDRDIDPDIDDDEDQDEDGFDDGDDVSVDYDNSLGDEEPRVIAWVAVHSRRELTDGMTVIELPSSPAPGPGPRDSALRAQLAQVQRQADLTAIERQRLAEQLDEAEERIASLVEEREQLIEDELDADASGGEVIDLVAPVADPSPVGVHSGGRSGDQGTAESAARLDAALVREQVLRWELNQVKAELEQVRSRPVDELEAELARLRAQLAARAPDRSGQNGSPAAPRREASDEASAETVFVFTETTPPILAMAAESPRLRGELDRLLRRIERGGMPTLELHRALKRLRGFFQG
jgi:hypothetical protein